MITHPGSGAIAVYNAIEEVYSLEGKAPGIRRIMQMTGHKSTSTIHYHIDTLVRLKWLRREERGRHYNLVPIHYPRVYYRRAE